VSDSHLDPFDDDDFVSGLGAGAGLVVYADGQLSLAVSAMVEVGGTDAAIRGSATELGLLRLQGGPELRYHFIPRSYAFVRAFAGALRAETTLEDPATGTTLQDHQFAFSGDLSAGVAYNIAGQDSGESTRPRFWLALEGGYGLASLRDLKLQPQAGDPVPARFDPVHLPAPSLSAPFTRLTLALTL
jgi:hypothetical protein